MNVPTEFYRNTFTNQRNGVNLVNSTATVGLSKFYNNTLGIVANKSNLVVRGASTSFRSNFGHNLDDISVKETNLEVFNCFMDSCRRVNISSKMNNNLQLVKIHDNIIRVTDYPNSANEKFAIVLDRPRFGNGTAVRANIQNNHITILEFGDKIRGGMSIIGSFPTRDVMEIDSNTIFVEPGGTDESPTNYISINISSAENFRLTHNTIRSQNTFGTGSSRWGVFLNNGLTNLESVGNLFWNNDMSGVDFHDDGCCAFHAENAGPWSICSNTTDKTLRGFHMMGTCGLSTFGQNTIIDHSITPSHLISTGLLIQGLNGDNAFVGDQSCQDNYWTITEYGGNNTYTAALFGEGTNGPSPGTVMLNRFQVQDIDDPHQAPTDRRPGTGWFSEIACRVEPTGCPTLEYNDFNERDEQIITAYSEPGESPGVEEWQNTRVLISKMMRYPNLVQGDYADFRSAYANSSAELFARFDSLLSLAQAPSPAQANLDSLKALLVAKQAELSILEAGITDINSITAAFWSSRSYLMSEIAAISGQITTQSDAIFNQRESILQVCDVFNAALPDDYLYEQNQITLNAFSIKLARGIELTPSDSLELHEIAAQCIQDAGITKGAAAGLLPPGAGGQYWREDPLEYDCTAFRDLASAFPATRITATPNPATDWVTILISTPFSGACQILDVSGKVKTLVPVREDQSRLEVPVSNLPNGVYFIQCFDSTNRKITQARLVILR